MALGTVFQPDFDLGVVKHLGGELVTFTVDGESRQAYAALITGSEGAPGYSNRVPIFVAYPEAVFQPRILPCIVVRPGAPESAWNRAAWYGIAKREPAADAVPVTLVGRDGETLSGWDKYVEQWRGEAFDLPYDVQIYARTRRGEAASIPILKHVMKKTTGPSFPIVVVDSEGDERKYDAVEISWSDNSDLESPTQRAILHQVSFKVFAEFELVDDVEVVAATRFLGTYEVM